MPNGVPLYVDRATLSRRLRDGVLGHHFLSCEVEFPPVKQGDGVKEMLTT
jgi:hypothetical protein